jgi:hypothetical protein
VVFNNPGSHLAVVVFTDGSHAPVVVDKSTALEVSAAGPADVNATQMPPAHGKSGGASAPQSAPAVQAVSQTVTCAKTIQKPYAPQITSVAPSSGTALITWSYQLLDEQDCEPDSWAVKVQALTGSHQPAEPVQVVTGQTQLQFTGLRPSTTYQVVVTAYINFQSTPSTPTTFTTAARGPDAPIAVHTTADTNGDWVVSWAPCTTADCVVPADTWNIIGAACGSAFVGTPPTVQVGGTQTSVTIPAAGAGGSGTAGLLGDSLSFSVQGVLASGLTGNPTADHACTQAWRPPNPAAITLGSSGVENPITATITATLQVSPKGTSSVAALGSNSTQYVYRIDGRAVSGTTTATTVHIRGLAAGVQYTPSVRIYPAGHPAAAITVTGSPFSQTLLWPQVRMAVTPSIDANPNVGTLKLSFTGLPPGLLPGQIQVGGTLTCGSTSMPIGGGVTNGVLTPAPQYNVDTIGTGCGLSGLSLSDTAAVNPYGVSDPVPPFGPFDFGRQPTYSFTAAYDSQPQCDVLSGCYGLLVSYAGPGEQPPAGINWVISATGVDGEGNKVCSASSGPSGGPSFPVSVDVTGCPVLTDMSVTVSWTYLGITPKPWIGSPNGSPLPPPTSTTSTTATTLPPCPTTTTSLRSTTTKKPATTSSTTGCANSARAGAAGGQLAAAVRPALPGDPQVRRAFEWAMVVAGVAWCVGIIRRVRRTRRSHRQRPPAPRA